MGRTGKDFELWCDDRGAKKVNKRFAFFRFPVRQKLTTNGFGLVFVLCDGNDGCNSIPSSAWIVHAGVNVKPGLVEPDQTRQETRHHPEFYFYEELV